MSLTLAEIEHLAELVRLKLTKEEKEKFKEQISSILDYMAELDQVEVQKVEPTAQITGLKKMMREDEVKGCPKEIREKLLNQAPAVKNNLIKVKAIFGKK